MDSHMNNDTAFAVPFLDPYEIPFSLSFFDAANPTLDDFPNFNINNNGTSSIYSELHPLFQQIFNNGSSSSFSSLPPLPQQKTFINGSSSSVLAPLSQQQDFFNNGVHIQPEQGNTSFSFPTMEPMMQDHFLQSNDFSFGGQQGVVAGNFQTGLSSMNGNQIPPLNGKRHRTENSRQELHPLASWPPTPVPYFCSSCEVLREILHTNGIFFEKLVIHGKIGNITHAIHHQNINWHDATTDTPYGMIDFSSKSIEEIKQFLVDYCEERNSQGSTMLQDSLSAYYEALCTGMDWTEDLDEDDDLDGDSMEKDGKRDLAVQRERAAKMTLNDLSDCFHLPIDAASKQVKLCPTVLKKICRRSGLTRWPYRKVKSIMKQITILGVQVNSSDPATRRRTRLEIKRLQNEMVGHCGGVSPSVMQNINMEQCVNCHGGRERLT